MVVPIKLASRTRVAEFLAGLIIYSFYRGN